MLHLHKSTRTDSGICIYDPSGEVHGKKIRLRLNQGPGRRMAPQNVESFEKA